MIQKYWLVAAGLAMGLAGVASAQSLDFSQTAARDVAAQISTKYGVNIVFKQAKDADKLVTFSVANADTDAARLEAINDLANALGADFQKTYVVSKADAGADVAVPKVDTNASIAFPSLTISAQDAVTRVAGVDGATAQFYGTTSDTVTLSALKLTATEAARETAQQTHTRWKVFFALTPRAGGRATGAKIIGRTAAGAPITEDPYTYYQSIPEAAPPVQTTTQNVANAAPNAAQPNMGQGNGQTNYGFNAVPFNYYGFDTYAGNNPYSQNLYPGGYGMYGPTDNGSGLVFNGGSGFDSPIVFGGGGF